MKPGAVLSLCVILLVGLCVNLYASGIAYKAEVFATVGAEPNITIVVTDSNGLGCLGVPVNISVTTGAGIPVMTTATTEADGTTQVAIVGSALGDTINVFCGQVTIGISNSVTASAARAVTSTDAVVAWFDESRHTVNAAVIDPVTKVMVSVTSDSVDYDDIDNNGDADTKRLTFTELIQQDETDHPYQREVYQGTYDNNNIININVDDITGDPDVSINLSSLSYNNLFNAYATGGASPKVVAVVVDREGRGIGGVTITAQSVGGSITPASAMTNVNGVATFFQSGTIGNTVTVSCVLPETLPITIITQDSVAISSNSKVFSWFEKKTRMIYTAITERTTNVLIQNSTDLRRDVDELSADNIYPYPGDFIEQTSQRPGSSYVVYGGSEAGDLIRIYHYGTIYRYPGGALYNSGLYGNSVITMPANESQYLMACAAGGTDPIIWTLVVDQDGNAVKDVDVSYTISGSGSLALSNTKTAWSGIARNQVIGGSLGDTITVSSPGLGEAVIYLSITRTPSTIDRVYGVYDPETHLVYGAVVQPENNVMTDTFTYYYFRGYDELDQTPGNGVNASISYYFHPQSDINLCQGYTGFGTIGAGDILRLRSTYTSPTYDFYIHAGADSEEYLLAFATTGDLPEVWAIVMDKYGNAVANKTINFSATAGSFDIASGTTNYGGFLVAQATSVISYGNTITVSSPGLPPVNVWTSPASNYSYSDKAFMWFDPTTLLLRHACVEIEKNVLTNNGALSSSDLLVVDNSDNSRAISKGGIYSQSGSQIGTAFLCFGTPGVGDIIRANFNTSNDLESFITIQSLNTLYLHAYAEYGSSPNIVAVVTDADGNGLPDYEVSFSALTPGGSMEAPPPGGFKTGIDGSVKAQYTAASGWGEKIQVTTLDFNSAPIEVITYSQTWTTQTYYKAIPYYDRYRHKVNTAFVHEYFNTMPSNAAVSIEEILPIDQTSNQKTVAVSPLEDQKPNKSAYAYLGFGTNDEGDQISINDTTAEGSPDALITLRPDVEKYLFAFGTAGATPTMITAIVVDKDGNGLAGEEIIFTPSGGSLSLTHTATDAAGTTKTVLYDSPPLGTTVTISAPNSVSYTVVVQTADAVGVAANSRVYPWYSVLERVARAAIVNLDDNILTSTSVITFTPQDTTPNGRTFALGSTTQQSGIDPSQVSVTNGTQGEGDMIIVGEGTTSADPDSILTITVPTSEIISSLVAMPAQVSVGQYINVTMSVFNNGSPDALSVSPTALAVTGNATWIAGPTPGAWATIPGGEYRDFSWTYQVTAAGSDVVFNGYAFGVDSFTMTGVTSTATDSNTVIIQTPAALECSLSGPDNAERLREFTLTMTVINTGQATAVSVTPVNLMITPDSTSNTTSTNGPSPPGADIAGGGSQDFTWTFSAADEVGTLWFTGQAQGYDYNSAALITSASATSNTINVIQGALNLDRISSPATEVYQGQKGLAVTMHIRNTSLLPVTITAATLTFNGLQQGFVVSPALSNPQVADPQSAFELNFTVEITKDAPLGSTVIDGAVSGDAETGAMAANGALQTTTWQILEAFNSLRQNYPNPLRLSQNAYTTFEYFVREDTKVSLKIYNLAGELVAVLYEGKPGVGRHSVQWYGDNGRPGQRGKTVGSGVYIAVFQSGDYKEMKKVVLVR